MKTVTVEVPDEYEWDETYHRFKAPCPKPKDPLSLKDAKVGDKFLTNLGEIAELISTNGGPKYSYLFLIHRLDVKCDDTTRFDINGCSFSEKYYIKTKMER